MDKVKELEDKIKKLEEFIRNMLEDCGKCKEQYESIINGITPKGE